MPSKAARLVLAVAVAAAASLALLSAIIAPPPGSSIRHSKEAEECHRVRWLPGWDALYGLRLFSGSLPITKHKALFYSFVEAERRPRDAPVVLWLTGYAGGARCSQLLSGSVPAQLPAAAAPDAPTQLLSRPGPRAPPRFPLTQRPQVLLSATASLHSVARSLPNTRTPLPLALPRVSGPGCSSVATAFLAEHGPFFPRPGSSSRLMRNEWSYSRVTMADFRLCSTCKSYSQASFYHYALRLISVHRLPAHMIYLDAPAGVGFSASNSSGGCDRAGAFRGGGGGGASCSQRKLQPPKGAAAWGRVPPTGRCRPAAAHATQGTSTPACLLPSTLSSC